MSSHTQQLYEQMLVLRSQLGDERAFEELLRNFGPGLSRFANKMLQSSPDAVDDLLQETWLAIYTGLTGLRDVSKFRAWAMRIARDRIYREYRRRKQPVQSLNQELAEDIADDDETDAAVCAEQLQHGLQAVSPEHREVLVLYFFEEMSYEEIADATGAALGTIRSRLHYAKCALRRALKESTE